MSAPSSSSRFALFPLLARFLPPIGVVSLAIAAVLALIAWNSTRPLTRAEATVTENIATQTADGTVLYVTHLRFRLPTGKLIEITDPKTSTDPDAPDFPPGKTIPVLYPAGHPESARVATIPRTYGSAIFFALWGVVLFDAGTYLRLRAKRKKGRQ